MKKRDFFSKDSIFLKGEKKGFYLIFVFFLKPLSILSKYEFRKKSKQTVALWHSIRESKENSKIDSSTQFKRAINIF
jgi:hypothetical protein